MRELPAGQSVALLEQLTSTFRSIFLENMPLSSADWSVDDRGRKKRRRSEREKQRLSSGGAMSGDAFSAAMLRGVDMLSRVLLHTPLSLWNSEGMHRQRAVTALHSVKTDVYMPLMKTARDVVSCPVFHVYCLD